VSLFGISFTIHGISLELTYSSAESGSNAAPPHSAPPSTPGKMIVPSNEGGAKKPLEYFLKRARTSACASGVRVVIMSSVKPCRVNGGGFTG